MKKTTILFLIFSLILFGDSAKEELASKIKYALNCNAKFSKVDDVEIAILKPSQKYENSYIFSGTYRNILSISGNKAGFGLGDEFHPQSGTFKGIVDKDLEVVKMKWKVGVARGYVASSCLRLTEDDL